jgi:hypothetical protein
MHIHNPFVSFEILSVEICQKRVGTENPSSGSNTVSDVDEFSWEKFVEIFEEGCL